MYLVEYPLFLPLSASFRHELTDSKDALADRWPNEAWYALSSVAFAFQVDKEIKKGVALAPVALESNFNTFTTAQDARIS